MCLVSSACKEVKCTPKVTSDSTYRVKALPQPESEEETSSSLPGWPLPLGHGVKPSGSMCLMPLFVV